MLGLRYIFYDWDEEKGNKNTWVWRTSKVHVLSRLCAMETLDAGIIGWGCCRLINVSTKKPAESAALALPPAVAVLRKRSAGDQHLTVSFHTAVLHQVTLAAKSRLAPQCAFVSESCLCVWWRRQAQSRCARRTRRRETC